MHAPIVAACACDLLSVSCGFSAISGGIKDNLSKTTTCFISGQISLLESVPF